LLPLESYGHYMLAWTLCSTLPVLASTVVAAFFPRLSAEVARVDGNPSPLYHQACQLLACALMPAGALLILFPAEILTLWLGDPQLVRQVAPVLTIMALGSLLNTLAHLGHAMQLAAGLARLGLYANIFMVTITVPAIFIAVRQGGVLGAAWVWVALNATYIIAGIPIMHRWILRGEFLTWLWVALNATYIIAGIPIMHRWILRGEFLTWLWGCALQPAILAFVLIGLIRISKVGTALHPIGQLLFLATIFVIVLTLCLLASSPTRQLLRPHSLNFFRQQGFRCFSRTK